MDENRKRKVLTLVFLREADRVLLGMKKRGFGAGKWNGFGGKVEQDETVEEAAAREVREECGLTVKPDNLDKTAVILFEFAGDPVLMEVHVFQTRVFSGELTETEEMKPEWYPESEVPFHSMWADDVHWYPLMFAGVKFKAFFLFEGHSTILRHSIDRVEVL